MPGLKPRPTLKTEFSAVCLAGGRGTGCGAGRSRRSGWRCWSGSGAAVACARFRLGLRLFGRGCVGTCCGCIAGCFRLLGSSFSGVVVHIPACAFKAQRGRGHRADQDSLAFGAFALGFGAEVLDLFKAVAARGAAIFIEWQANSSGNSVAISILVFSTKSGASRRFSKNSEKYLLHAHPLHVLPSVAL